MLQVSDVICCLASLACAILDSSQGVIFDWQLVEHFYLLDGVGGILGKEIRVVLQACAVMCIRNFSPPPGQEEDFVFEGFRYADE